MIISQSCCVIIIRFACIALWDLFIYTVLRASTLTSQICPNSVWSLRSPQSTKTHALAESPLLYRKFVSSLPPLAIHSTPKPPKWRQKPQKYGRAYLFKYAVLMFLIQDSVYLVSLFIHCANLLSFIACMIILPACLMKIWPEPSAHEWGIGEVPCQQSNKPIPHPPSPSPSLPDEKRMKREVFYALQRVPGKYLNIVLKENKYHVFIMVFQNDNYLNVCLNWRIRHGRNSWRIRHAKGVVPHRKLITIKIAGPTVVSANKTGQKHLLSFFPKKWKKTSRPVSVVGRNM